MERNNLMGKQFAYWTIIDYAGNNKHNKAMWLCKCKCGKEKIVVGSNIINSKSTSCGCYRNKLYSEKMRIHGHTKQKQCSREYATWSNMKSRCLNPNRKDYKDYGGRGIIICDRWLNSFQNFLDDMGERPTGKEIDRINNNGNYEPSNCRWVDKFTNMKNTRRAKQGVLNV